MGLLFITLPVTQCVHWAFSYIFCGLLCLICLFSNHTFPGAFTNSLGLPCPNYLYLILGADGSFISPLISLLVLLWACCGPFSLFCILLMSLMGTAFKSAFCGKTFISAPNQVLSKLEMALSLSPQGFAQSHIGERCLPLMPYKPLAHQRY